MSRDWFTPIQVEYRFPPASGWFVTDSPPFRWNIGFHPHRGQRPDLFNRTLLMMLAMFVGENRDDWDDLLLAVMMAYRSSVHESTGFSPYRLMFGEECMLPMDVGLPRREPDLPDPINSPYAVWVRDALEVAYDQVRRHS